MSNFFYDMNKRMAELAQGKEQLTEGAQPAVAEGSIGDYSAQKARAGKDIGKPGKQFAKIARGAAERYGSKERGEKVAGAVLAKLRGKNEGVAEGSLEEISRRGFLKGLAGVVGGLGVVGAANQMGQSQNLDAPNVTTVDGKKYTLGRPSLGVKLDGKTSAGKYKLVKDDNGNMVYIWNDVRTHDGSPTRFVRKYIPVDQINEQGVAEGKKPDFIDIDNDGNRTEPMKQAARQAKGVKEANGNMVPVTIDPKQTFHGIKDKALLKDMINDARAMDYDEFHDEYSRHLNDTYEFWANYHEGEEVDEAVGDERRTQHGVERETPTGRIHTRVYDEPEQDDDDAQSDQPSRKGRKVVGAGKGKKIGMKIPGKSKLLQKGSIREADVDIRDQGEYDQEGDMAKDDIHTLVRDAQALEQILGDNDNLPEWVQAKLTKAKGMISAVSDYMQTQHEREGESEMPLREKAVSVKQRRAAGIAHAAQKGDIPKSELRGASKAMAKMPAKELKKFAKTKEKGLPVKKGKEEVEETTVAGSVATAPAEAPKKSKGMQFGKGIYDSMNRDLEAMIAESMSVNISTSTEGSPSVSVTATDEDAAQLAQMLRAAGIGGELAGQHSDTDCPTCGSSPCGCAEVVDENQPDWPTNTETSNDALQYSGGLNKPKTDVAGAGQTTVPVTAVRVQEEEQELAEAACNMTAEGEMCPEHGMAECGMYEDEQSRILELAGIGQHTMDEEQADEGNLFTGNLAQARAAGKTHADLDGDGDMEKVRESDTGDAPISKMSDQDLAEYTGMSVAEVKQDRERAEEVAREKSDDLRESEAFQTTLLDMSRLWKQYKA